MFGLAIRWHSCFPDERVECLVSNQATALGEHMAFSDFTLPLVKERLGLILDESADLFAPTAEADLPPGLIDTLRRYLPLALNLNTEKARSELVIAPVLVEFKLQHRDRVSLFSGIDFTVDEAAGLKGRCDYILARSPEQLALTAPVCVLVESQK